MCTEHVRADESGHPDSDPYALHMSTERFRLFFVIQGHEKERLLYLCHRALEAADSILSGTGVGYSERENNEHRDRVLVQGAVAMDGASSGL